MTERIVKIRKTNKLTQQEFAKSLGITRSAVQGFEYGTIKMGDRTIRDICRIYGVNETWLRTGEGEMYSPKTWEQTVADLVMKIYDDDNEFRKKLIQMVANLTEEQLDVLQQIADTWLSENK